MQFHGPLKAREERCPVMTGTVFNNVRDRLPSSKERQAYHVISKCCLNLIDSMDELKTSLRALQQQGSAHTYHPTWGSPSQLTSLLTPRPRHSIH